MKASVLGIDGKKSGEVELPAAFSEVIRSDLIRRAVIHDQTLRYQPKGPDPRAGMKTSARYRGRKEDYGSIKNHGIAMLPREVLPKGKFGKVRIIPSSVKGRRAQGPHVNKILVEEINKKEYAKAIRSAIAATANEASVKGRGHKIDGVKLPLIIDNKFESVSKTKDAQNILEALGLTADLARATIVHKRSGVGSRKGGRIIPRSALIVVGNNKAAAMRAARNIAGVDIAVADKLTAELLAPGTHCGRLTIYTQSAIDKIAKL